MKIRGRNARYSATPCGSGVWPRDTLAGSSGELLVRVRPSRPWPGVLGLVAAAGALPGWRGLRGKMDA